MYVMWEEMFQNKFSQKAENTCLLSSYDWKGNKEKKIRYFVDPNGIVSKCFNSILVSNFKSIPSASSKLLNLSQQHPSKKLFLLVKSL